MNWRELLKKYMGLVQLEESFDYLMYAGEYEQLGLTPEELDALAEISEESWQQYNV